MNKRYGSRASLSDRIVHTHERDRGEEAFQFLFVHCNIVNEIFLCYKSIFKKYFENNHPHAMKLHQQNHFPF